MPAFLHKIPLFCYSFRVSTQRILSYQQCRKHKFSIASFITGTSGMGGTPITGPSSQYAIKSSLLLEKLFLLTTTCKTAPLRSPNSIKTDLTRFWRCSSKLPNLSSIFLGSFFLYSTITFAHMLIHQWLKDYRSHFLKSHHVHCLCTLLWTTLSVFAEAFYLANTTNIWKIRSLQWQCNKYKFEITYHHKKHNS